ncbi:MAG: hypothetical protein ACON4O_02155 [Lentimonas sp.]
MKMTFFSTKSYGEQYFSGENTGPAYELTVPNVMITRHRAFFTSDASIQIARITLQNLKDNEQNGSSANKVKVTE